MTTKEKVLRFLDSTGVKYELIPLPKDIESSVSAHMQFHGRSMKYALATMIYSTENGFVAVQRRSDTKTSSKKLREFLKIKRLRLVTEEELKTLGYEPGLVPLAGFGIPLYADSKVLELDEMYGGVGDNVDGIKVNPKNLFAATKPKIGNFTEFEMQYIDRPRILTGDRPTGKLHIGHLMGSLLNRVKLQDEYDQFVMIANVQALTDNFDHPEKVRESIVELLCDYYAVGIDFDKSTVFIQSEVPQIHEIFVYLANFTTVQQVSHNPTIKTELKQKDFEKSTPLGFFFYPVHQAGDILCVNADLVPVGKDQAPMVEGTRDLARKFNETYKVKILHEPEALFGVEKNVPGIDGSEKMGKSLGNAIYLSDDEKTLREKIFKVYTDPGRIHATDPGKIEGNIAFAYHDLFNENKGEVDELKERYKAGKVGDVEVKEKLFVAMNKVLTPIRERRLGAEAKKDELLNLALTGSKKVSEIASGVVDQMKEAMKIKFN